MSKQRTIPRPLTLVGIFVLMFLLFLGSLTLVRALPEGKLRAHVIQQVDVFRKEGLYPRAFRVENSPTAWRRDNYTDTIMFMIILPDPEIGAFRSAVINRQHMAGRVKNPITDIMESMQGPEDIINGSYARYWHGYQVFLKPMMSLFAYDTIRVLGGVAMVALLGIVLFLTVKVYGSYTQASLFLLSLLLTSSFVSVTSLQYMGVFFVALAGALAVLLLGRRKVPARFDLELFLVLGATTSFIDLLTAPLLTLGIPLLFSLMVVHESNRVRNVPVSSSAKGMFRLIIRASMIWAAGYALMWISKWLLVSAVTGTTGPINDGFSKIAHRAGKLPRSSAPLEFADRIEAVVRNLGSLLPQSFVGLGQRTMIVLSLTGAALLVLVWAALFVVTRTPTEKLKLSTPFIVVALMPFAWYLVVGNHSYIHYWFTNKILLISLFGLLLFVFYSIDWSWFWTKRIQSRR